MFFVRCVPEPSAGRSVPLPEDDQIASDVQIALGVIVWDADSVDSSLHACACTGCCVMAAVGVVVRAGVLDEILKKEKVLARYERKGGLYTANVELSAVFPRPGGKA